MSTTDQSAEALAQEPAYMRLRRLGSSESSAANTRPTWYLRLRARIGRLLGS